MDVMDGFETARLLLRPNTPQQLLTLIEQPDQFEAVAGFSAAAGLHEFFVSDDVSPEFLTMLRQGGGPDPWLHGFTIIHRASRSVIGSAGFKGPPDGAGMVEIAYGIVPDFEGHGYATEAAAALVALARATAQVRLLRAHTLPAHNASTRVLTKCGFAYVGLVEDPDDGPVWRWERLP